MPFEKGHVPHNKKKPVTPEAEKEQRRKDLGKLTTDGELIDIWERRILNPRATSTARVRIKTPGMRLRWINLNATGRYQRARFEQGWVPVQREELVDEREIFGVSYTTEGYVCRGEKQQNMLMKIPEAVYKKIMKRMVELNQRSYKNLKANMASSGSQHFTDKYGRVAGDQAADAVGGFVGDIKFGTERVSTDELLD